MIEWFQVYQNDMPQNIWIEHDGGFVVEVDSRKNVCRVSLTNLELSGYENELNGISIKGKSLEQVKSQEFNKQLKKALTVLKKLER